MNIPTIIYANCIINYSGRAESTSQIGNHLIIIKSDNSLIIHGNRLVLPLNYMSGKKNKIIINNSKIISTNGKETINIEIINTIHQYAPEEWSDKQIDISKTEKEIVNKLIDNIDTHFKNIKEIIREYQTPYGPIDILVINEQYNIIEAKRKSITLNNCIQLEKYLKWFEERKLPWKGFVTGPSISQKAKEYIEKHNLNFIKVEF